MEMWLVNSSLASEISLRLCTCFDSIICASLGFVNDPDKTTDCVFPVKCDLIQSSAVDEMPNEVSKPCTKILWYCQKRMIYRSIWRQLSDLCVWLYKTCRQTDDVEGGCYSWDNMRVVLRVGWCMWTISFIEYFGSNLFAILLFNYEEYFWW